MTYSPPNEFSPFIELVIDVERKLVICGNRRGEMFLATEEFCNELPGSLKDEHISVLHVEREEEQELAKLSRYVMNYGQGFYVARAGYHAPSKTWVLSGEVEWYSPLRMELERNGTDVTM